MAEDRAGMEGRLLSTIGALIDSQKRLVASLGTVTEKFDRIDADMVKLTRHGLKLHEELSIFRAEFSGFRSDATARLNAISARLEDLENICEQNAAEIKGAKSEIVSQQNEILNALQPH